MESLLNDNRIANGDSELLIDFIDESFWRTKERKKDIDLRGLSAIKSVKRFLHSSYCFVRA